MPDALALIEPLTLGLPAHGDQDDVAQAERRLISHLLLRDFFDRPEEAVLISVMNRRPCNWTFPDRAINPFAAPAP